MAAINDLIVGAPLPVLTHPKVRSGPVLAPPRPRRFRLFRARILDAKPHTWARKTSKRVRRSGLKVISAAVLLNASTALACAVCGVGADQDQGAYLSMTIMMSLLPLTAIGAVVYWFVRQTRS